MNKELKNHLDSLEKNINTHIDKVGRTILEKIPSTQTNSPLLINDTYPGLEGAVEAELRFTGEDNVQLEYEIQEFDSNTRLLIAWFKMPIISDGDIINIYFDNISATDKQNASTIFVDTDYIHNHLR